MKKRLIITLVLVFPCLAKADSGQESHSLSARKVIETKIDLGLFGLLGGGMTYSVNGKKITRDEDFQRLIYPLRDEEASKLIHDAREEHFVGALLYLSGVVVGADLALFFKPNPLVNIDFIDRIGTGLIATQIFTGIGAIFDANADGRRYNAVQRYNKLIQVREDAFLGLSPQFSFSNNRFNLGLVRVF
ncbi:MAG TPA: hypothetical protein VIJ93_02880 [bacterium]